MASTRANSRTRSAGAETPKDAPASVLRHGAHIHIAALTTTASVIAGWARAADRMVQAVGDELLRRVDGRVGSRDLVVQVAWATDAHPYELAALPSAATNHFDTRRSRVSSD